MCNWAYALGGLLFVGAALGAPEVDWKLYDSAMAGGSMHCFYEKNSITHTSNGLRVRTECLLQSDLNAMRKDNSNRAIIDVAAWKLSHGYVPPIVRRKSLNDNQAAQTTVDEVIADISGIHPRQQISYEIDCRNREARALNISKSDRPYSASNRTPMLTGYDGSSLPTLLCTAH